MTLASAAVAVFPLFVYLVGAGALLGLGLRFVWWLVGGGRGPVGGGSDD